MQNRKRTKIKNRRVLASKKRVQKKAANLVPKKNRTVKFRRGKVLPLEKLFANRKTQEETIYRISLQDKLAGGFFASSIQESIESSRKQFFLKELAVPQKPENVAAQFANLNSEIGPVPIRRNQRQTIPPVPRKKIFNKTVFYSLSAGLILAGVFSSILYVFAVPPTSKYDFGATLEPNCSPGGTNCSVVTPAQYSFTSNNFSGTGTFTTSGAISGGAITGTSFVIGSNTISSFASLSSLAGLSYASTSFVKMTGANAFTLDTSTYYKSGDSPTFAAITDSGLTSGRVTYATTSGQLTDSSALTFSSPALTIGVAGTATGQLKLAGTTSGTITVTTADAAGTWTLTLPSTAGTNKYALTTNGSGTASWSQIDLTAAVTGTLPVASGGTNATATPTAGAVAYGTGSAYAFTSAGSSGQLLQSAGASLPAWTTATYPATATGTGTILRADGTNWVATTATYPTTTTANQILYSTAANTVGGGSGLTFDGTTLTVTATGGAQGKLAYNGSNYTTFTSNSVGNFTIAATGTTGDIVFTPGGSGAISLLSDSGSITFGGNGGTNNENLKFDFETTANTVGISSTTSVATLSLGADVNWTLNEARSASTNGSNLTIQAAGGLSGGTNLNGGTLYVASGISTGSGSSDIFFQTATPGGTGTTDRTPSTKFTIRGTGNVVVGTGTALATNATGGFLYIPTSAGAQTGTPVVDTTGTAPIVLDTTNGRFYAYYGGAWKYAAITTSFQIPIEETVDPISGDKMKEGDIVMGMIDKTMEDEALHGIWVKWESVKSLLLKEARGELSRGGTWGQGTVTNVETETLLERVKNVLESLGISIKDRVANITEVVAEKFSAKTANIELATIKKLQMVDSETGEIYCTWVANGEWQKVNGECNSSAVATAVPSPIVVNEMSQALRQSQEIIQQAQQAADNALEISQNVQEASNNALETSEHAQGAVQEKVEQVVQQAADSATEAAKQAVDEVKEEIKQEVKEEIKQEAKEEKEKTKQEEQVQPSEPQPAPEEPAQSPAGNEAGEQPAAPEILQDAGASLLDAVIKFVKWLLGLSFNQISKTIPDDLTNSSTEKMLALKNGLPSAQIKFMTAGILAPVMEIIGTIKSSFQNGNLF